MKVFIPSVHPQPHSTPMLDSQASQERWTRTPGTVRAERGHFSFLSHHPEVSGLLSFNQSPSANAWPKIAVSQPLVEFARGEIANDGEDAGVWGLGQELGHSGWVFSSGSTHPKLPWFLSTAGGSLLPL